jgi:hypothetical protein
MSRNYAGPTGKQEGLWMKYSKLIVPRQNQMFSILPTRPQSGTLAMIRIMPAIKI